MFVNITCAKSDTDFQAERTDSLWVNTDWIHSVEPTPTEGVWHIIGGCDGWGMSLYVSRGQAEVLIDRANNEVKSVKIEEVVVAK